MAYPRNSSAVLFPAEATSDESASVHLIGSSAEIGEATLPLKRRSLSARIGSAVGALILGWVFAGLAVFIPALHFILVPVLVLGSPVLAFFVFRHLGTVGPAELTCPDCHARVSFAKHSARLPTYAVCTACGQHIAVTHRPPSSDAR